MITIYYNNCYSHIDGLNILQKTYLDKELSVKNKNAFWSTKFKEGKWDGKQHFFSIKTCTFASGLLSIITGLLKNLNAEYEIKGIPEKENIEIEYVGEVELRDYQKEAVEVSIEKRRGILFDAVNAGKTAIALSIIKSLNKPTLWITHLKTLKNQVEKEFKKIFPEKEIGTIGDGVWNPQKYTIAIFKSLNSVSKERQKIINNYLKTVEVVISDELAHSSSHDWYTVLMKIPATYRYGLSGTPMKNDDIKDTKLIASTGEVIHYISQKELIERKISAEPIIFIYKIPKSEKEDINLYDNFCEKYEKLIVNNRLRNGVISLFARELYSKKMSVLIYIEYLDHYDQIYKELCKYYNGKIEFISGETSQKDRDKIIKDFEEKKFNVLICTRVLKEGVNIQDIDALIIASAGIDHIQTIGRVLRGGNRKVYIFDFDDQFDKILKSQSRQRIQKYIKQGFKTIKVNSLEEIQQRLLNG